MNALTPLMDAAATISPMEAGVSLILLAVFAYGVREAVIQIGPVRPSPNAAAAIGLCLVIGAMLFGGAWIFDGVAM